MVNQAEADGSDIVIGSRFCAQKKPISARMIGSALITAMIRLTTGQKVQDPTSGMRLFDRDMIRRFALNYDYSPEPDTIALCIRNGAKVSEMQVEMRDRTGRGKLPELYKVRSLYASSLYIHHVRTVVPEEGELDVLDCSYRRSHFGAHLCCCEDSA